MDNYIVVTLGPIFDTINMASSPAALWAGSYLFSYLNKTICRLLTEHGVAEEDILTPYYSADSAAFQGCDGVGLYHDRIIFRAKDLAMEKFAQVRQEAIDHLAETFWVDETYLQEYLMIRAAYATDIQNPILDTGKILDCMELAKPVISGREDNPLISMLIGKEYYGNESIKNLPLTVSFRNWQLRKPNGQLRSISDIAGVNWNTGLKKHNYYAIVRSDGDHMGDIIARLSSSQIRDFSKQCMLFCADAAKKVHDFGGVAIYSGGDDLLAILPCENPKGENVFRFVRQVNEDFAKCFPKETYHADVSLSFGVTICFHKFPLYEALEDSRHMLFDLAKSRRNCTAIHLQKHAGQSEGLIIPHNALDTFIDRFEKTTAQKDGEWFQSVHHKLKQFRKLFLLAGSDMQKIRSLFANIFDAASHNSNNLLHEELPQFYYDLVTSLEIESVVDISAEEEISSKIKAANSECEPIDTLCYILRLFKFYVEKGGAQE